MRHATPSKNYIRICLLSCLFALGTTNHANQNVISTASRVTLGGLLQPSTVAHHATQQ